MAFACLLEVKGKSLLLKTAFTSSTRLRGIELNFSEKLSLWGIDSITSKGTMQAAKGEKEKESTVLDSCNVYELQQWPILQDGPRGALMEFLSWRHQSCLIWLKAHSTGWNSRNVYGLWDHES